MPMTAKPVPLPDEITAFYWRGADEGRLLVSQCAKGHRSHPPAPSCSVCGNRDLEAVELSGDGTVYSFAIVRQAFAPEYLDEVPYLVALIELAEDPRLRVLTNLVDVDPEAAEIGMAVTLTFEARDGQQLPQFRPAHAAPHAGAPAAGARA
jgi:uncharacterized protein